MMATTDEFVFKPTKKMEAMFAQVKAEMEYDWTNDPPTDQADDHNLDPAVLEQAKAAVRALGDPDA